MPYYSELYLLVQRPTEPPVGLGARSATSPSAARTAPSL